MGNEISLRLPWLAVLLSSPALADPRADTFVSSVGNWFSESEYTIGVGAGYAPEYTGSKHYQAVPYLSLHMMTPNGFYLDTTRGVGWQTTLMSDRAQVALGFSYDPGRAEKDDKVRAGSDRLKGMGDVKGSVLAATSISYLIFPSTQLSLSAEQALTRRDRGLSWQVGLGHLFTLGANDSIGIAGAVHLGDSKYNQTYFGVTEAQSKTSRFKAHKASSGINSYSVISNWTHQWNKHWSTDLSFGVTRYVGDAEDSPLMEKKISGMGLMTVDYTF